MRFARCPLISKFLKPILAALVLASWLSATAPAQTFTVLANFNGTDGSRPLGLVEGPDGNFYGVSQLGGVYGHGAVFEGTTSALLTSVYSFCAQNGCPDGQTPAGLIVSSDGSLYGTTEYGGTYGAGAVFKVTKPNTFELLYSFCAQTNCADGTNPFAGVIQARDGSLYGTTLQGGGNGSGTVFKLSTSGVLTVLYSFCSQAGCSDGKSPVANLIQGSDGNFYGTTENGGSTKDFGTVFMITSAGVLTTLHTFQGPDGSLPLAPLIEMGEGNFYGTTSSLGGMGVRNGTIFKISSSGLFHTLHVFSKGDGAIPEAPLVRGPSGNLYGTTYGDGLGGRDGTLFEFAPGGVLTVLHTFNGSDGMWPFGAMVEGSDGNLYGTASQGGADLAGTFFSWSPNSGIH